MQCAGFQSILQASDIPGFGDIPSNIEQLKLLLFSSILRTRDTATGILNIQQIVLSNNFSSSPFLLSYFRSHFLYQAKPAYEQSIMLHVFVSVACKAYCYTFNLPNL